VVKAINKLCSKDLQAAADGYCKFWVYLYSHTYHAPANLSTSLPDIID
jgi:hypothetical protein